MKHPKIPEITVMRLSSYSRTLEHFLEAGEKVVSSTVIARETGVTPAQVRKDLAYFGEFGVRGLGYNVEELYEAIAGITGTNRSWKVVIVGLGHLGGALVSYPGFLSRGFEVVAIYDIRDIGKAYGSLKIRHISQLIEDASNQVFDLGIIVVPRDAAQGVADLLVEGGIRAILNFAPANLKVPEGVEIKHVDLSMFLETLSYHMTRRPES